MFCTVQNTSYSCQQKTTLLSLEAVVESIGISREPVPFPKKPTVVRRLPDTGSLDMDKEPSALRTEWLRVP